MYAYRLAIITLLGAMALPVQADEDLDVTMRVIDEETSEDRFVNEIALPSRAAEQAHENAATGMETSNQARQQGSEFGAERSQGGAENGRQGAAPDRSLPPAP